MKEESGQEGQGRVPPSYRITYNGDKNGKFTFTYTCKYFRL